MTEWREDTLGAGFTCTDIELGADSEGPLVATLVRSLPQKRGWWQRMLDARIPGRKPLLDGVDVLYMAGWCDYFFQRRTAQFFTDRGARFYALDVRKSGRSLRPGQSPEYVEDIAEYDEEIASALAIMRGGGEDSGGGQDGGGEDGDGGGEGRGRDSTAAASGAGGDIVSDRDAAGGSARCRNTGGGSARGRNTRGGSARGRNTRGGSARGSRAGDNRTQEDRPLILFGHSFGGLVLSLWADRHPGVASGLILNSPWLEFQVSTSLRQLLTPIVDLHAKIRPLDAIPHFDQGVYMRALREVEDPEYPLQLNAQWRPERSFPVYSGWLRAVLTGHARVAAGIDVAAPALVLLSDRFALPRHWNEEMTRVDTAIDVSQVAKVASKLGHSVTIERIDGAMHNVFLSRRPVADQAYSRLEAWLRGWRANLRP